MPNDYPLGPYLRDRRARLDPIALGYATGRRRTPGLRREEVAQRANVSVTWYTWLEQGRGGAPSAEVLERLAHAMMMTEIEREHLFLLALGRPPEPRQVAEMGVSPRLQRLIDAMPHSAAIVRNTCWDVLAWNDAARAVLTDYAALEPAQRNILRLMFLRPEVRAAQLDWPAVARFVVAAFRADVARAKAEGRVQALIEELSQASAEFAELWAAHEVGGYGEGTKVLRHASAGLLQLEYSSFSVDGRPDLALVVYNPSTEADAERMRVLIKQK